MESLFLASLIYLFHQCHGAVNAFYHYKKLHTHPALQTHYITPHTSVLCHLSLICDILPPAAQLFC